jgi:hypothetical protein
VIDPEPVAASTGMVSGSGAGTPAGSANAWNPSQRSTGSMPFAISTTPSALSA